MYISPERQKQILEGQMPSDPEELAYFLTMCTVNYVHGTTEGLPSLNSCIEVIGVLDIVKNEFQRRIVNPMMDVKQEDNGDIFPTLTLGDDN